MNSNGTTSSNGKTSDTRIPLPDVDEFIEPVQVTETSQILPEEAPRPAEALKHEAPRKSRVGAIAGTVILIGLVAGAAYFGPRIDAAFKPPVAAPAPAVSVVVSPPIAKDIEPQLQFLGQFAAVDSVELRPQVGGTLTSIGFKDGEIVQQGTVLFTIDPTPYSIKLAYAQALVEAAKARIALAGSELVRGKALQQNGAFSIEDVESRASEQLSAQAALDDAKSAVRDAQFDLDHCQITAPFTGKIGTHLTSLGNLIAGSRAATSPTTLLTTVVSVDPIWVNFDMSESDYLIFLRQRAKQTGPLSDKVTIALSDENSFKRSGTLDFVDNTLDRSSGTIHARATIPNKDLLLTPGGFARIRVTLGTPEPALLVPDAAIFNDQSNHVVMTVDADSTVIPKVVELGDMRNGLRVIRSGLSATDRVIIDGAILAKPGAKVSPSNGTIQENQIQQ
jgi:membrane fusion protein, multidrug efflux system